LGYDIIAGMVLENNEKLAIGEFERTLREKFGKRIRSVLLYGSKARGSSERYSDIDLFVLVDREDKELRDFALATAYELNLKYDVILAFVLCNEDKINNPVIKITPFYNNVFREGKKIES
jgi:uncharacterized protein